MSKHFIWFLLALTALMAWVLPGVLPWWALLLPGALLAAVVLTVRVFPWAVLAALLAQWRGR